jgi:hypothetical protein
LSIRPAHAALAGTLAAGVVSTSVLVGWFAGTTQAEAPRPAAQKSVPETSPAPLWRPTVLTAAGSGLSVSAFSPGGGRAADAADVLAMPPTNGSDAQRWLIEPTANGELVILSLAPNVSGTAPLLLTTDRDNSVYLREDRGTTGVADPSQLWEFDSGVVSAVRTIPHGPGAPPAQPVRIRAHSGGCLVDNGNGERLSLGSCDSAHAWWWNSLSPEANPEGANPAAPTEI